MKHSILAQMCIRDRFAAIRAAISSDSAYPDICRRRKRIECIHGVPRVCGQRLTTYRCSCLLYTSSSAYSRSITDRACRGFCSEQVCLNRFFCHDLRSSVIAPFSMARIPSAFFIAGDCFLLVSFVPLSFLLISLLLFVQDLI